MSFSGLALRTKTAPDGKESYGKIKKQESVNGKKHPDIQSSTKQKPFVVKFSNVAFLRKRGERLWFFKTHVIPGINENKFTGTRIPLQVFSVQFCYYLCMGCEM